MGFTILKDKPLNKPSMYPRFLSFHRKPKKQPFKFSTEQFGQIREVWLSPVLSVWRHWDNGTSIIFMPQLRRKTMGWVWSYTNANNNAIFQWVHCSNWVYSKGDYLQQTPSCNHAPSVGQTSSECHPCPYSRNQRDVIFRRMQLNEPLRQEVPKIIMQAHLLSVIRKLTSLLEYQGVVQSRAAITFLKVLYDTIVSDVP